MVNFVTRQPNPKASDSAAGRLVWVQRKNSSWWPGQIMDVSESYLDEAKSNGVPIKLLGRDDVDVEWYNLEVAKHVKAFRCGDFESCIGNAKAVQANSSKRKQKLSKRDNAIILALELEASLMSKDPVGNFCEAKDLFNRKKTRNHSEHDDREGIKKRYRGLDDLDMRPNSLENKSVPQNPSSLDDLGPIMDGSRGVCVTYFRKKRSKVVFQEVKKEDSIDLLTNLMQSDNSVPITCDEFPSPCKLYDSNDISSESLCCNPNTMPEVPGCDSSGNLFDARLTKEELLSDGLPSCVTLSSTKNLSVNEAEETENGLVGWQLKRKRNPRQERRNPEDQFHRYEFLESCIKPHTNPKVYYDVKIEVDKRHCSKNVPNISVMSILNRKPVSGQPISVEVLEDGSCDFLLDTRTRAMKIRPSACIPIRVVFCRIHEALDGIGKGNGGFYMQ